jgi:hypothetical protein
MAQPIHNTLLPLSEAARLLPGAVTAPRLYAWMRLGVRRVYLESVRRGHILFTSQFWIDRFLDRLEELAVDLEGGELILKEAGL